MRRTQTLPEVDACLRLWGRACQADYNHPLSYPHKNILYGLSELGIAQKLKQYSKKSLKLVDQIDDVVQRLAKTHPHLADALLIHYVKLPHEPLRQQAKTINVPKSTYFDHLNKARRWVWQRWGRLKEAD